MTKEKENLFNIKVVKIIIKCNYKNDKKNEIKSA